MAPSPDRIGCSSSTVSRPITSITADIISRAEDATRPASSKRLPPISRDTTAPSPIDMPIETEICSMPTAPVKPIAAVRPRSPRREM